MYVHVHVRNHLKDKFAEYVTSEIIAPKYVCSLYELFSNLPTQLCMSEFENVHTVQ